MAAAPSWLLLLPTALPPLPLPTALVAAPSYGAAPWSHCNTDRTMSAAPARMAAAPSYGAGPAGPAYGLRLLLLPTALVTPLAPLPLPTALVTAWALPLQH